ncbi:MAG: AraC family transcriptional regulator [Bacteroidota bacterium]
METVEFYRPDGRGLQIEIIKYRSDDSLRNKMPERHRHNFHSIFFIQEGYSEQEVDFESYSIHENQVMIIPKGAVHWEKKVQNLAGYTILFTDDFFSIPQKRLLDGFLQYTVALRKLLIPLDENTLKPISLYFELLEQEQEDVGNQNQIFLLQNLMLALLNKLEGLVQNLPEIHSFVSTRKPFQQFISLLENNFHKQEHKLDFYASELKMTKRKLNEVTKRITGQTASNVIIDRIIIEAKRELCFSEKSIKEIAFALGYESQYYFSRIFKKKTGMNPEQFRIQHAL